MYTKEEQMEKIEEFVNKLAEFDVDVEFKDVENPYQVDYKKENLRQYLLHLVEIQPKLMLVGEAPGYKGCGRTGIAFTDECQLKNPANYDLLGDWKRSDKNGDEKEMAASTIWEILGQKKVPVLIWNAFPFHPYKPGNVESNRTPRATEARVGIAFVEELKDIFGIDCEHVYGIGNTAQNILRISDERNKIRHPAFGGKVECQQKLSVILDEYQ